MIRHALATAGTVVVALVPIVAVNVAARELAHGAPPAMAACQYEDSPGPCVWDARHMGNGSGKSFIRKASGRVEYVGHRRAHRLAGL